MRKATQKTAPTNLGTKRSCPGCGTKFYDFNKEEIACPKCEAKVDPDSTVSIPRAPEKKNPKIADAGETDDVVVAGPDDVVVEGSEEGFESVEDLDDEDDDLEDIEIEEDEEGDF